MFFQKKFLLTAPFEKIQKKVVVFPKIALFSDFKERWLKKVTPRARVSFAACAPRRDIFAP